jgi:hypothetical protein
MGWKRAAISVSPSHSLPVNRGDAYSLKTGLLNSQLPQPLLSPHKPPPTHIHIHTHTHTHTHTYTHCWPQGHALRPAFGDGYSSVLLLRDSNGIPR